MYEEEYFLEILVHLAWGWLSFRYTEKFLLPKFTRRRRAMAGWLALYLAGQMLYEQVTDGSPPYSRFTHVIPYLLLLGLPGKIFFRKDTPRQAFSLMSLVAGWEILRFIASPLAHGIFSLWSPFWGWLVEYALAQELASAEVIMDYMQIVNRAAIFAVLTFCRAVQVGLLWLYLRSILKFFSGVDSELGAAESWYLLFPCITVLVLDLTLRLMAYSVDNSALMLIYDRVPETLLLLPTVSLLLLGVVVSSVRLFRGLVQYKDEERKRLLLENSVAGVHRQIAELTDIYGNMRGLRHDLRHHIASLAAYIENHAAGSRELESYLAGMTATVEGLDFADRTGNAITDVILHQCRLQAKRQGITLTAAFRFPAQGGFDVYDVSVILNNALQNALEAAGKLAGEKEISLRSYERGSLFFIEVENDFDGELNRPSQGTLPATTKANRELHGMGLANIRRCAQKYRGDIDINVTAANGRPRFTLTVMLYKREKR